MKKMIAAALLFSVFLHVFAKEKTVQPKPGIAAYQSDDLIITMALIHDLEKFLNEWKNAPKGRPIIQTAAKIKPGQTLIPIVVYSVRKRGLKFPVYCDADLIKPDGTASESDKAVKLQIINSEKKSDNFFLIDNIFGFSITDKYERGRYRVRLRIYNSEKDICILESEIAVEDE